MLIENTPDFIYGLAAVAKRLLLFPRSFRLRRVHISGKTVDGIPDYSLSYLGEMETYAYLKRSIFMEVDQETITTVPALNLKRVVDSCRSGTLVVEANRLLAPFLPPGRIETYPWIRQVISLNSDLVARRKRKLYKSYGRKARRFSANFIWPGDPSAVKVFYRDFYLPYIRYRYQDNCHARTLRNLLNAQRSGFLLQVLDQGRWVGGTICSIRGNTVRLIAGGLVPQYEYHLRRGVLSSCDYFLMEWARENGMEVVDFMRSRPNSQDGLFEYKRKWGATPVRDSWPHTALHVFVQPDRKIPLALQKQLVWHRKRFVELGSLGE